MDSVIAPQGRKMRKGLDIAPLFAIDRICEHTFVSSLLSSRSVVVDLGANRGEFAHGIIDRFGCQVCAAEPLASLQEKIEPSANLKLFRVAIGSEDGTAQLHVFRSRDASVFGSRGAKDTLKGEEEVEVVSVRTFLSRAAVEQVDLMKVDIEGAELTMLEAASEALLHRIGQITVEFHDFIYPELKSRVEAVKKRLEAIGFWRINFSLDNTDVLFLNRAWSAVNLFRVAELKYFRRNVEGGKRWMRRMIQIQVPGKKPAGL
jgi:FkbM family methyltransferase